MVEDPEALARLLRAAADGLAGRTAAVESTAATPEQVDLVRRFRQFTAYLDGLLPRVILGEVDAGEWEMLATVLAAFSAEARRQVGRVVLEQGDVSVELGGDDE